MFLALAILLFAWFIEMPLWVSILSTIFASVTIIVKLIHSLFNIITDGDNED